MDTKQCSRCKEIKDVSEFNKYKNTYQVYCRECSHIAYKEWAISNPEQCWARNTRHFHKSKNKPIFLSNAELTYVAKQTRYCTYCGTRITYGSERLDSEIRFESKCALHSATIDAINPYKPLDKHNIAIVCHQCNSAKSMGTVEDLIALAYRIIDNQEVIRKHALRSPIPRWVDECNGTNL